MEQVLPLHFNLPLAISNIILETGAYTCVF